LANSTDKAIAFRDLKIETLNQPLQPIDEPAKPVNYLALLTPYTNWIIVVASISAGAIYVRKRKQTHT
jgi:hypothetical protein